MWYIFLINFIKLKLAIFLFLFLLFKMLNNSGWIFWLGSYDGGGSCFGEVWIVIVVVAIQMSILLQTGGRRREVGEEGGTKILTTNAGI